MLKKLLNLGINQKVITAGGGRDSGGRKAVARQAAAPVRRDIGLGAGGAKIGQDAVVHSPQQDASQLSAQTSTQKVVSLREARTAALVAKAGAAQEKSSPLEPVNGVSGGPVELPETISMPDAPSISVGDADAPVGANSAQPPGQALVTQPSRSAPTVDVLISSAGLPDGCVIVSDGGPLSVSEALRKEMAVLRVGESPQVVLVVSSKHLRAASHVAMLERIKKAGLTVYKEFTADSGLITSLYSTSSDRDGLTVDSGLAKDLDVLISRAIEINASDIHVNIRENVTSVKMRRNGRLTEVTQWHSTYAHEMIRAIHAIADDGAKEGVFSELEGQSMMVSRYINGQLVKLRCQTTPIYPRGMDFVARVLKSGSNSKPIPFEKLGYARSHIEMLEWMMRAPWGVTIFAGETGSGKSTSLFTMMTELAASNVGSKLYTVEDPPEYNMAPYGISQIPASSKRGSVGGSKESSPFYSALRSLMRLDPDIAMVGEIRDSDSADAVVNLVRSGHKIVSTLHASGALSILERLMTFGVDITTMTSRGFIAGLIAQRLAPVLCPHCKVDYDPHMHIPISGIHERIKAVTTEGDTLFVAGAGCDRCDHTGVSGQTVLAEMVIMDGKLLELLRASDFNGAYEYWRSFRQPTIADINGSMVGMTMLEHGILKMRQGLLAPDELELRVGPLTHSTEVNEAIVGNEVHDLLSQ